MNHYTNIFFCFGESKVCFGVIFFRDGAIIKVVYDKKLAESFLNLIEGNIISFDFISEVRTSTANKLTIEKHKDMRHYFDDYMHRYCNGIVRYSKSNVHSDIAEQDLRKVANVMFGKINPDTTLIEV